MTYDLSRASALSAAQVQAVVNHAFPKGVPHSSGKPVDLDTLRRLINTQLKAIKPSFEFAVEIGACRKVFHQTLEVLDQNHVLTIAALGSANERQFGALSTVFDILPKHICAVRNLRLQLQGILTWFDDSRAIKAVKSSAKPIATLEILAGHFLPDLFQMFFFRKFGSGNTGPGPRFVSAILRESGVHPGDDEQLMQFVRTTRRRRLTVPPVKKKEKEVGGREKSFKGD